MAAAPPTAELPEVRALAAKLFAQCKGQDAPSSYQLLAASVRKLRNALEEVEEDYDPTRTIGPDDVKLLGQIGRSYDILSQLDHALQAYGGSAQGDVNMNAVSDLKTALDVSTHQLKVAFEATTTGEIPLQLDTRDFPNRTKPAASVEDSSATWSRKSSVWSLAYKDSPRSPGASDATSVHNERLDRVPTEEKQVLSPSLSNNSYARASMDWRTPFADPMSMGFEAATSFILGGDDDDLGMSAYARPVSRARAVSDVSVATETFVSAPASPETERKPSTPNIDAVSASITGSFFDAPGAPHAPPIDSDASSESAVEQPEYRRWSSSSANGEEGHLRPETATRELALKRTRTNSNASNTEDGKSDATISLPTKVQDAVMSDGALSEQTVSRPGSSHEAATQADPSTDDPSSSSSWESSPATVSLPEPPTSGSPPNPGTQLLSSEAPPQDTASDQTEPGAEVFAKDLGRTMEAVLAGEEQPSTSKPLPLSPIAGTPPSEPVDEQGPASPPPPTRRPPPPPPTVRRSKPNIKKLRAPRSKYRIVNDAPDDSSSDDELYTTSQPSSPVKTKSPPSSTQSPPLVTPTIQIDQSALDEFEQPDQATALPQDQLSHEEGDVPQTSPQLPQTVYKSPSSPKPPIFAQKGSSKPSSQRAAETAKEDVQTASSSPAPRSPPSLASSSQRPQSPQSPPLPPAVQRRVDAAAKAGENFLTKEIEARSLREGKPPPVPRRPKSRYNRPRAATAISSPAVLSEKEIAAESGLEPTEQLLLASKPSNPRLVPRVSVDHALNVSARDSMFAPEPAASSEGTRHARAASTSQLPNPRMGIRLPQPSSVNGHRLTGWYGPGVDETPQSELDSERIQHIEHFWNSMAWDRAEDYLMGYLESLIEQDNIAVVRRVRHLLAVCAAFKGDITRALTMFLSILDIKEPSDLNKPGNCEACYWLGDLYAMQNLRLEALLAYCAAQWGDLFKDPEEPNLSDLIKAEQEAVQLGSPKSDFKVRWSQEAKEGCGSILDPQILPAGVVQYLFEVEPRREGRNFAPLVNVPYQLDPNKPRSSAFFSLSSSSQIGKFRRNRISAANFMANGPWPLQFDPTFAMANVKRERLLGFECDLLSALQSTNGEAKIPKTAPMSLSRMDCFTCNDLPWLITAVRDSLTMLEMEWSEVANEAGVWFVVRHALMDGSRAMKMATVHYFAISLFRQSWRTSYGVEICSHGVSSARIMDPSDLEKEKGVHQGEAKRIRKLIRETLEEKEKEKGRVKGAKKRVSSIGLGISARGSCEEQQPVKVSDPPSIPPRPR